MTDREIAFIRAIAANTVAIAIAKLSSVEMTPRGIRSVAEEMGKKADEHEAEWEKLVG